MKSEPFAKSLIATSLALSCLMAHAASVAPVAAENGMVVTAQHLASHVGVDVLKNGGNAVDAAVAVGYALAVVYPAAGNLAVGVPGTVSGMELALSKYGTKPRKEVIAPAIKLAEDGFVLEQGDVELLEYATDVFKKDMKDSGSIFLNILEGYPMKDLGYHSAQGMHYQIEAMRHAYVDRNSYLGDPDFVKNPIAHLLDKNYATKLREAIQPQKAGVSKDLKPGVAPHEGSNTTHYSIVDKWGNAVSVTYTLNDWFGAGVMASKTGVILNDEMDDFTSKIGVPNMYGLVQCEAIAPGKAPLSSMSPTIVTKDGKVVMVVGTPGAAASSPRPC